jgi:hypothetical protein
VELDVEEVAVVQEVLLVSAHFGVLLVGVVVLADVEEAGAARLDGLPKRLRCIVDSIVCQLGLT